MDNRRLVMSNRDNKLRRPYDKSHNYRRLLSISKLQLQSNLKQDAEKRFISKLESRKSTNISSLLSFYSKELKRTLKKFKKSHVKSIKFPMGSKRPRFPIDDPIKKIGMGFLTRNLFLVKKSIMKVQFFVQVFKYE
jgi:hypothetical protein